MIDFPLLNAGLNGSAGVLLILGYLAIRKRNITCTRRACCRRCWCRRSFWVAISSIIWVIQQGKPTYFSDRAPEAPSWVATAYLVILGSHTILAVIVTPMALLTAYRGLRGPAGGARPPGAVDAADLALCVDYRRRRYWMLYRLYPVG